MPKSDFLKKILKFVTTVLRKRRLAYAKRRAKESNKIRNNRLEKNRIAEAKRRAKESSDQRTNRLEKNRVAETNRRARKTKKKFSSQKDVRLLIVRIVSIPEAVRLL
ncbi:hypothetical protein RDWZM_008025 [Blomia tropicalis]|uniref:Uncharacterized protein n=1 Tax=Blomia tropicalis TaxID=40697 RepID=A0A9Q0M1C2_BLOTA|nr:hypothetical protein RDWZM_008025 [Blomia tropicalis]